MGGLNETVKVLAISGIKERHPNETSQEVFCMLVELMLGAELARNVYDPTQSEASRITLPVTQTLKKI